MPNLADAIRDRSARGIALTVADEINRGALPVGSRLPTVRTLAAELGVSTATVAHAWGQLARAGLVQGRGKAGTKVTGRGVLRPPLRYSQLAHPTGAQIDLSQGVPDGALLPDARRSMQRITRTAATGSYFESPVIPELAALLEETWPFAPGAITVVDGALDALSRLIDAVVPFGSVVLVENPTFPPILDLLEARSVRTIGLPVDDEGLRPEELKRALALKPVMLLLQPRAHNPRGQALSRPRMEELASLLRGHPIQIVEDDHSAYISSADAVSLGEVLPEQTVLVRSFSKSHGPDLRLAAIGGCAHVVDEVVRKRYLGPGWSSHLLQALLYDMLTDPDAIRVVNDARDAYRRRREALAEALRDRHVVVEGSADGINMWVQVADERSTLVSLGLQGIIAAPGSPFEAAPLDPQHIRLTYASLTAKVTEVADAIAASAQGSTRHFGR